MIPRDDLAHARLLLDTLSLGPQADAGALGARWKGADHGALVTLAKYEGAELWLARRLRTLGVVLTSAAAAALDAAASRSRARNLRADAALAAVLHAFHATQVECVLLKSAALRQLTGRLPLGDARASADVDLLVSEAEGDNALGILRARGWELVTLPSESLTGVDARPIAGERGTWRASRAVIPAHHLPSVADRSGVAIELHLSTGPTVRPLEAWRRAMSDRATVTVDGMSAVVPSDSWLLVHAVAHALGDTEERARAGLRLRYWLDGALLIAAGQVRWQTVRERVESGELGPPQLARTWLWTAAELAGRPAGIDELGHGDLAALQLDRMLAWRLHVLARHDAGARWGRKLLEEGARIEAGLDSEMPWKPASLSIRIRQRGSQWAARAAWWGWRARL